MNRRQFVVGAAILTLLGPALVLAGRQAVGESIQLYEDDRILGDAEAKVTIIEYASLTCPHCATLHTDIMPRIKSEWIDTGKARLVYRHFPLDGVALRAAALTDCLPAERHYAFLDMLFEGQQQWARADDPVAALGQRAKLAGLSQSEIDSCLADEAAMAKIMERRKEGSELYDVDSTPTLIIDGHKLSGTRSYEEIEKVLQEAAQGS
ncbi:MAG: DsbA family protein [Kiloniellales bacterium]